MKRVNHAEVYWLQMLRVLARMNLTLPKEVLVDPQIFSVRIIDLETGFQRWYQRMYINLDRNKFDDWLLNMVSSNVEVINGRCVDINGGLVKYILSGKVNEVKGSIIVGADGANSIVRRKCFKPIQTRTYTAIQKWFFEDKINATPFYSCIFDSKTSDCCSWTISKDGYLIFGGAFPKHNSKKRYEKQREKLEKFGINLDKPIKTEECLVLRPRFTGSFVLGNDKTFLIGEAAGFISPSSLEGISSAFNSAIALSESLSKGSNVLKTYKRKTLKLRAWLALKNLKCPFMYNPFLRKIVMKSGIGSININ